MALSRTNLLGQISPTPTGNFGTGNFTTTAFTPPSNSLLVVGVSIIENSGTTTDPLSSITVSGGGWTYTGGPGVSVSPTSFPTATKVFTAPVGTGASMALTIGTGGRAIGEYSVTVVAYTGYNTGAPTGATATGTQGSGFTGPPTPFSITLSAAPASTSEVFAVAGMDKTVAGASPGTTGTWTEVDDVENTDWGGLESQARTGSTSTTVDWADLRSGGGALFNVAAVAIEIVVASASTATYPPQRARSREAPPLRVAKTRQATPVRTQVNPPYPTQEVDQTRRLRGMLARRGEIRSVTPPQFNPPFPFIEVHPTRQLRGLLPRRGRLVSPVPPQVVLTPPAYPPQVIRSRPRILRWFRGREAQPVPPPVVVTPPAFVPDRSHRSRLFAWVRREHPAVPLAVPDVPVGLKRDKPNLLTARRPKMAAAVPAQTVPPIGKPARHPAALRLRHGGFIAVPLKLQLPPVNPAFVPAIARRRVPALPTRRGKYVISWASSCDCVTHHPNAGTTAWINTGVTAHPNTGTTSHPCTC